MGDTHGDEGYIWGRGTYTGTGYIYGDRGYTLGLEIHTKTGYTHRDWEDSWDTVHTRRLRKVTGIEDKQGD